MADKLLKLRVKLTFAQLYKLRKLCQGESLSTPMASEDSLPPMPELREHLYKAWHNPCLPTKRVARRALALGWEAIQGGIDGTHPIIQATRHLFTGNQAMKYAEYNMRLEEALDVQPLPRVDTNPHGLGLFTPSSDFKEPSGDAGFDPSHGPKAGPGSIINLPAWPTPPSDQTRLGNSSTYWASSINLDASLLMWQDIPLHNSMPGESATPMLNPSNTVGEGIKYPGGAWDSVTDTPTLPALGATRAHDYYTNLTKVAPFSLSHTLFPHDPVSLAPLELEGPSAIPTSSQSSSQKEARRKAEAGHQMMTVDLGKEEEAQDEEVQTLGPLPMEDPQAQAVPLALLALLAPWDPWDHLECFPMLPPPDMTWDN
ncbi:hypothetical protein BS47DRAFT_1401016 [Hydnum rufescens UP504]|uniref:Uncharacterized protein n=1 Tax=Hydnum rufescens UP504 TaxID=1448309 RepID=A0A9P6AF93_9AGAM|nr:hypothetical protein BS47DRAFT_1401016 [Hydnum rufescens UP504]